MVSAEEATKGQAAELARETALLNEPSSDSETLGMLPGGTILMLTGERIGPYVAVEVELVDRVAKGWVAALAIREQAEDSIDGTPKGKLKPRAKIKKGVIPKDESVLLKRQPSFFYGVYLGLPYSILDSAFSPLVYQGMGIQIGGEFGLYLDTYIDLRFFGQYSQLTGGAEDASTVGYGFFDFGIAPELIIDEFRIFALAYYGYGASLSDLPLVYQLQSAADVSSIWAGLGVGYWYSINEYLALVPRLMYAISFNRAVVGMQWFGLSVAINFQG